ncbi:MAG: flagellar basal body L-ring protein FlgH [Firmicutes bacterium]|nr:flagellar basal body L-ring protein FlgH [Bacillota bacterium]
MGKPRSRVFGVLCLMVLLSLPAVCEVQAQSLWNTQTSGSLFSDHKALQVGDLVTIIIVERTEARSTAQTTTGQSAGVGIGPGGGLLDFIPLISVDGSEDFEAGGSTTRGGTLSAKLTAMVKAIEPNGNLQIEGKQRIIVNGEEQQITVSGTIRPQDVARDNSVLSTYVANATISYSGEGALGSKQEPGILSRLLNWLF